MAQLIFKACSSECKQTRMVQTRWSYESDDQNYRLHCTHIHRVQTSYVSAIVVKFSVWSYRAAPDINQIATLHKNRYLATWAEKKTGFIRGFYIYTLQTKGIKRDLPSSGALRLVEWYFHAELSEQPTGPIFKGQGILGFLATSLSRNVDNESSFYAA